ncbi:Ribosomal protein L1p/L10e family [Striga hermonthica]|uniref:Ribosomal protein L1p/L10e family n=1 Tax=Striga hermonthica TaxID=68872 RepID=A0A9N7MMB2_STRHE|nr:Ribosomal protein L1p/L10e family [Striga hermonthica]
MASIAEPLAAASRLQRSTVDSAVSALLKFKSAAQSSTDKLQLLPEDDYIYLNLTLKKIPSNPRTIPFRIPLPHPILDAASQLCLIIDDRPKSPTPPPDQIKKLIKAQDIPISKVIRVSKLKSNYKPYEAKRKLCDSYDLFLVDKRVVHLLPKLIGKKFFKKKKLPLGVDMGKKNLKLQVERALGSALLYMRTGTCCVMKVSKVAMEKEEIVDNVLDAVQGAVQKVPKKWDGVRSLHLKFSDSVALPIYQAMPDVKLKIECLKESDREGERAKDSENEGETKEMSGRKEGKVGKKKKGRIHEVHYMDVGEDMESDGGVNESERVGSEGYGTEGDLMEEGDYEEGDTDDDKKTEEDEIVQAALEQLNRTKALKEKSVKKEAKAERSGRGKPKKDESSGKKGKKKKIEIEKKSVEKIAKVKGVKHKKKMSS